ncbi:hypothetical protein TRFO_12176 [Tritrichomonas foetus]|uniref:LisH domain-containing protein n=1 Tax=Tritrichomonas foetus TaxID=1144522 RepID=A0A1J4J061_9EUKA|nr:hypothetical protein TRFO_12176 [Tritrichomonas foetus]|eukprot:OHS92984.1 hypothetical protein TRFO_12176 [Tritrichomonas foetus]
MKAASSADEELKDYMYNKGVTCNIQARLLHETCNEIQNSDSAALSSLQPQIRIERNVDAWEEAVCLVVAYLKRYRMKETVQTMRKEFAATPAHTGYKKGSEVDDIFDALFDIIERDMKKSFEERVDHFIKTTQIEEPARKQRPRRK